jgi:hypothetical protein
MTRDEELAIREAAMFCWEFAPPLMPVGGVGICALCGDRKMFLWRNLAEHETIRHAERHLGQPLAPKDAATICGLRALGCKPEDIVQQVTGHPPCIAADMQTNYR